MGRKSSKVFKESGGVIMTKEQNNIANYLYDCRKNFSIVALTGVSGSGCSGIARMMEKEKFYCDNMYNIRKPDDIRITIPSELTNTELIDKRQSMASVKQLVFKREYTICYNYVQHHYKPYSIIKYNKVLWLYVFRRAINLDAKKVVDFKELKAKIVDLVQRYYQPSYKDKDYADKYASKYSKAIQLIESYDGWEALYKEIATLDKETKKKRSETEKQNFADIFFNSNSELSKFYLYFNEKLSKIDYYCYCFFYHRLAFAIRSVDDPFADYEHKFEQMLDANEGIFVVVKEINWLIKCLKAKNEAESKDGIYSTRVCIDSLRNSLEAAFLRERFSAFYMIAVNDDEHSKHLYFKIQNRVFSKQYIDEESMQYLKEMQAKSDELCAIEAKSKQYTDGQFAGANISQCVADAEIHLVQPMDGDSREIYDFNSVGEQWIKMAALILHPGLITPSPEERCMEVAYTAKFNSGCISRQVGAVITNKNHAIRSIGWNDVPYGQIPCALRELPDLLDNTQESVKNGYCRNLMYSSFELAESKYHKYKELYASKSFKDGLRLMYEDKIENMQADLDGLQCPYCFKDLHNEMCDDKNQVFTRSLHAEENAMMQMVKYGGEGLMEGIIYVTASPCELCSKKLYQLGVRKIVYIDPYPGIAREHIIANGFLRPNLQLFKGVYGATYYKLYQPFMAYKDELTIRLKKYMKRKK